MAEEKETFEDILEKLRHVVHDLEEGNLPLEDALKRFEVGVKLSREGARRLKEVELRVEEILANGTLAELDVDVDKA